MPWVKLDDQFPDHPAVDALSEAAFRLHVAGLCHCARYMTDGRIPGERVPRLVPRYRPRHLIELLDSVVPDEEPLWVPTPDGYFIPKYTKYNGTRRQWEDRRANDAKRIAKWREERAVKWRDDSDA